MENGAQKSIHVALNFPDRALAKPAIERLSRGSTLSVNILRGRITEHEAWFELELAGRVDEVDELIRVSAKWGARIHPLHAACVA
jgi:hypothetical protein